MAAGFLPVLGIVAIVYLGCLLAFGQRGFWIIDNANKYILTQVIERTGGHDLHIPLPDAALDPHRVYNPMPPPFSYERGGELYSVFPPFFSGASAVMHRTLGFPGLFVLPLIGGVLVAAGAMRLGVRACSDRRMVGLLGLLVAFASPVWFYSLTFWENVPAAACVIWGIVLALRADFHDRRSLVLASAALFAAAAYFRDDILLASVAWPLATLPSWRRAWWRTTAVWAIGVAVCLVPMAVYHVTSGGGLLGAHIGDHLRSSQGLWEHLKARPQVIFNTLLDSGGQPFAAYAFALPLGILLLLRPRIARRHWSRAVAALAVFAVLYSIFVALGLAAASDRTSWLVATTSLFPVVPLLAFGLVRLRGDAAAGPADDLVDVLSRFTTLYVVFYMLAAPLLGTKGITWTNRHLLLIDPLLIVIAVVNLERWRDAQTRRPMFAAAAVAAVCTASVLWQFTSIDMLAKVKRYSHEINQTVDRLHPSVVMTDLFWVPQTLYTRFLDTPMFYLRDRALFQPLIQELIARGYQEAVFVTQSAGGPNVTPVAEVPLPSMPYFTVKCYRLELKAH